MATAIPSSSSVSTPLLLSAIPPASYTRTESVDNIGARCTCRWVRIGKGNGGTSGGGGSSDIQAMSFMHQTAAQAMMGPRLLMLAADGTSVVVNARTGLVDEKTTPTNRELAPLVAEGQREGGTGDTWVGDGDLFSSLLSLDAGTVHLRQSSASATEPTLSASVRSVYQFTPNHAVGVFAADHVTGHFATASASGDGVLGVWSFSHNRVAVPLHALVVMPCSEK
jgi:hypothetical protein